MKKKLSTSDVAHLADLSALKLSESEVEKFQNQLIQTLDYMENLNELPLDSWTPTNHVTDAVNVYFNDGEKNTRALSREEALKNSKKKKDGYFKVDKIFK